MAELLTAAQLAELRRFDSPTIANAIETFNVRDRTEGYMGYDVRCLFPELGVLLGYAVTATADSTRPGEPKSRAGLARLWEALEAAPQPAVLVFQDVGSRRTHACFCGETMATIATRLGAVGLVTDGGVRDLPEVRALGFYYFAAGAVVSHGTFGILDVQVPVTVSGATVQPGDLLHGDVNGVVLVPLEVAAQVAAAAQRIRDSERQFMDFARSADFSAASYQQRMGL
jgi:regulator of RNase E activity RraA